MTGISCSLASCAALHLRSPAIILYLLSYYLPYFMQGSKIKISAYFGLKLFRPNQSWRGCYSLTFRISYDC